MSLLHPFYERISYWREKSHNFVYKRLVHVKVFVILNPDAAYNLVVLDQVSLSSFGGPTRGFSIDLHLFVGAFHPAPNAYLTFHFSSSATTRQQTLFSFSKMLQPHTTSKYLDINGVQKVFLP